MFVWKPVVWCFPIRYGYMKIFDICFVLSFSLKTSNNGISNKQIINIIFNNYVSRLIWAANIDTKFRKEVGEVGRKVLDLCIKIAAVTAIAYSICQIVFLCFFNIYRKSEAIFFDCCHIYHPLIIYHKWRISATSY